MVTNDLKVINDWKFHSWENLSLKEMSCHIFFVYPKKNVFYKSISICMFNLYFSTKIMFLCNLIILSMFYSVSTYFLRIRSFDVKKLRDEEGWEGNLSQFCMRMLLPTVNFSNIFRAAFSPISFWQTNNQPKL